MTSLFRTPEAKTKILALYQDKLDELNLPYESRDIGTSIGNAHYLMLGNRDHPPLVLLHGANGCAPVGIESLVGLVDHFRIYAIDVPGQPNRSAEFRPDMKTDAYGRWLAEVLEQLELEAVTLVGISFGGLVSWKTLVHAPDRIKKAFLIVPAGIVNGNPLKALWHVFLPMQLYIRNPAERYLFRFLDALFTARDEFALKYLALVFRYFKMDFSPLPLISAAEAQSIQTPIYVIGAEQDLFFPGKKLLKRATAIFPSLQGQLLLNGSKHVPDQKGDRQIEAFILSTE